MKGRILDKVKNDFGHQTPTDFLTSQWQRDDTKCVRYLIYRWIIASFYVFSVLFSLATIFRRGEARFYFIYLTHLNLCTTMITMILGAVLVHRYHYGKMVVTDEMTMTLRIYWFLSQSSSMYAFLISITYWTVLYKMETNSLDFNNIIVHGTNSLMLFIDFMIVRHPARLRTFTYPLMCGFVYLFFSWFYPFLGGVNRRQQDFIYPILNWKKNPVTAIVAAMGVLIAGFIIHTIITCTFLLRRWIHARFILQGKINFAGLMAAAARDKSDNSLIQLTC